MTVEGCREWRERLGAYVLGQLSEDERAATAAHIDGCSACRAEADALAPIAELLTMADPKHIATAPAPPADLGERISQRIAAEQGGTRRRKRRRRGFTLGFSAAAATAAVAVAIAVVGGGGSSTDSTTGTQRVAFHSMPRGVTISATVRPRPFGTEIRMDVDGIRSGTLCRVFLHRRDGSAMAAGSFRYRYGGNSDAVLTSGLDLAAADAIEVKAGHRTFVAPMKRGVRASTTWNRETTEKESS
jgi:hypothetical protein